MVIAECIHDTPQVGMVEGYDTSEISYSQVKSQFEIRNHG